MKKAEILAGGQTRIKKVMENVRERGEGGKWRENGEGGDERQTETDRPKTTTQKERSKLPGSATGNLFYICGFIWHWGRQTSVHMRSCHTKIHISQMYSSYMLHLVIQQVHICCTAWFIGVICHIISLGQKVCHFLGHNKVRVG